MKLITRLAPIALLFTGGCNDVDVPEGCHTHGDELHCDDSHGLLTTLVLNFTPVGGGETLSFTWSDPENDGDPVIDDVILPDASDHDHHDPMSYDLQLQVWNQLEDPAEDVTPDIADQGDSHQFFFLGSAVSGPASTNNNALIAQTYADQDEGGLPIGLENTVETMKWGTGELTVVLRHMPPQGDNAVKTAGLADEVANNGFGAIGGGSDIEVTFNLEVE